MNTTPEFDDSDAFVGFDNAALSVAEDGETLLIPVTLASVKGLTETVGYTIIDGTAKEGVNFTLASDATTLSFNAENRTQYIEVNVIDNPGVFTGDLRFQVQLNDDGKVKPSAESTCTVTIVDNDHPLAALLGTWNAEAESAYNGVESWEMELEKDADDVTVVWFYPFVKGGSGQQIYGVVNEDMTEIAVPVNQVIATSSSYGLIELLGYNPDYDSPITGNITIEIDLAANKMTIKDGFGSYVWSNADGTGGLGWYNRFYPGGTLTK
jgi:hypothetical protein